MYHKEHPPAHFHAYYGGQHAVVDIETLTVCEGNLTRRAMGMVLEWAAAHRDELMANWELAQLRAPLDPIDPLE